MKKLLIIGSFLTAYLLLSNIAFAQQTLKIGIVDVETLFKQMPEAVEADKLLQDLGNKYRDTIMQRQQSLLDEADTYKKQKTMMTAEQQQKREEELRQKEIELIQYRDEKTQEVQQMRVDFLEPIRDKARKAIEKVAKEEKINLVLDKASQSVIYSEDKFDITFKVIDLIKRGESGE